MNAKVRIAIDAKNLSLYSGGIAHWFSPLLRAWITFPSPLDRFEFFIIAPIGNGLEILHYPCLPNIQKVSPRWPTYLKRQLRHLVYDNWIFPQLISKINPQCIISPYHDVLFPKKNNLIFNVLTVHDLCFLKVPEAYPWPIRFYYTWMLRRNIPRAHHILTVSETTRKELIEVFQLSASSISVIPNALPVEFLDAKPSLDSVLLWRKRYALTEGKTVLYASGIEHRKNIERLLSAFRLLWSQGHKIKLCITGKVDSRWLPLFHEEEIILGNIEFLGFLSLAELRLAYEAVDTVVYPSLCEGFGRSCLEAMACGTPLACSDIPVFQEVAGTYPQYFDPLNINSIANAIELALQQGRKEPHTDCRYEMESVKRYFIETINNLILKNSSLFDEST